MKLLTQEEAAERLGCSTSKIKRLRVGRRLTYIPGRPILIDEADLETYITAKSAANANKLAKQIETPSQRARRVWITHRAHHLMKSRGKSKA